MENLYLYLSKSLTKLKHFDKKTFKHQYKWIYSETKRVTGLTQSQETLQRCSERLQREEAEKGRGLLKLGLGAGLRQRS